MLPGARPPGHPEAQNAPNQREKPKTALTAARGFLQTPKELVESPFPLRNQTWKETFCSWTRKPNSYPSKTKFLSLIRTNVQYGPRITVAVVLYLYVGQFLSKKRAAQAMAELFGTPVSEGTVSAMSERAADPSSAP